MELLIIGTGYVGLVTAVCFAEMGHSVTCLDIDSDKINRLSQPNPIPPFHEPGLLELLLRNHTRLKYTTSYEDALKKSPVCFLCLPTPSKENGSCNLDFIEDAAQKIALHIHTPTYLVIKSTVPVGTAHKIQAQIQEKVRGIPCEVISNPEFLKEGAAISDCMKPDRIVLGVQTEQAAQVMREIYAPFTMSRDRILVMDPKSAEMTKYAANAMLATRISFMNELALLCEKLGANINEVRVGIGSDSRIGTQFLYPGIGYGGSCFPKDLRALQFMAKEVECQMSLIDAAQTINENQKQILARKIERYFEGNLAGKTIAIWGLSFKPDTDDMREAPSLVLIRHLLDQGAYLRLYDPIAIPNAKKLLELHPQVHFCQDAYEATQGAHAIALVTEWKQFRSLDFQEIRKRMEKSVLFDGRNQYKHSDMHQKGFEYFAIGTPHSTH